MLPLEEGQELVEDLVILQYTLAEASVLSNPIIPLPVFKEFLPEPMEPTKLGLDEIYMINLERRQDRRERMNFNFELLGLQAERRAAVDGKDLNDAYLADQGINVLVAGSDMNLANRIRREIFL